MSDDRSYRWAVAALNAARRLDEDEVKAIMKEWVAEIREQKPEATSAEIELEISLAMALTAVKDGRDE